MVRLADRFTATEQEALRGIQRACHAGLDSLTLRQEVQGRATPLIPSAGWAMSTCDPDTGLIDHTVGGGVARSYVRDFLERFYAGQVVQALDAGKRGQCVLAPTDPELMELRSEYGLAAGVHVTLTAERTTLGSWCLIRERVDRSFTEREVGLLETIAPHLSRGLKLGRLIDASGLRDPGAEVSEHPEEDRPGVVVLDGRCRVTVASASAEGLLEDIRDVGFDPEILPSVVTGARGLLRIRHAAGGCGDPAGSSVRLRTRGRSGRWYWIRALLTAPDAAGDTATLVVIEPVRRHEMAPILAALYGLTAREREILCRAAAGESTRKIALALGISAYTVQDHLDHACGKVGVRGRRALIAKIFLDGYLERVLGSPA